MKTLTRYLLDFLLFVLMAVLAYQAIRLIKREFGISLVSDPRIDP